MLNVRLEIQRIPTVMKTTNVDFVEALRRQRNKTFRRFNMVFEDGVAHFEQHPVCKIFDEVIEELYGPQEETE